MKLPPDSPDWLEPAIERLEATASEMLRLRTMNADRAAGFFTAVAEIKDEIKAQAEAAEQRRNEGLKAMGALPWSERG